MLPRRLSPVLALFAFAGFAAAQPAAPSDKPASTPAPAGATEPQPGPSPAQQAADRRELLTGLLRDWLDQSDRAGRDRLLRGLRRLRDPSLKPLFARLAVSADPDLRRHGILGRAELEPDGGIDLLAISKMADPRERSATVLEALSAGLLSLDQLQDVSRWPDLDDHALAMVACRLTSAGQQPAREVIDRVVRSAGPAERLRAALSALERQESPEMAVVVRDAADELLKRETGDAGRQALITILGDVRREHLWRGGVDLSRRVWSAAEKDPLLRFEALATLLASLPGDEQALRECLRALGEQSDLGGRLLTSLAVLEAGLAREDAPRALVEGMAADGDPLVRKMGGALKAVLAGAGSPVGPIEELAAAGHAQSASWALRAAKRRPWQDAQRVRLAVAGSIGARASRELMESGVQAAREVCDDEPAAVRPLLEAALKAGETRRVQAILLGAAGSIHRRPCDALPPGETVWPDDLTAALAAVLRARCAEPNDAGAPERFEALAAIAAGRGNLAPVMRFQAAWQALRATGDDRAALARILSVE